MKRSSIVEKICVGLMVVMGIASVSQNVAAAMNKRSQPVNDNLVMLSRNKAVLLLVDQQVGLLTGVRDITVGKLKHNVVALAKAARDLGVPVIITATMPDGMWGHTFPELLHAVPGVKVIDRTAVNAWDDPNVRAAVEKTGRRQLIIAGVSFEVCAAFPALSAKAAGYDTRVVLDASGTFNQAKRVAGLQRLLGAGIPVTDYASAIVEMLRSNADPVANQVYRDLDMPFATLVWQIKNDTVKK